MLTFLDNWTIDLTELPTYDKFKKPFTVTFDKKISQLLMSGVNPKITAVMISNYKNNVMNHIDNNNKLIVTHKNPWGVGRFYGDGDRSPVCHSKFIKHTVFSYQNWLDIDMVKGHSSILLHIGKKNGLTLPAFNDVVHNFDTKWRDIAEYYKKKCNVDLDEDNIKYYFNLTIYGGGYDRWLKKLADVKDAEKYGYAIKIIPENIATHPFMEMFKRECVKISGLVYANNPDLVARVATAKETEHEKQSCTMSYFCGIIENHIVYFVYNYLVKNGGILPNQCLPELDGICMPRLEGVDYDQLVKDINVCLLPIENKFKIKPYGKFVLPDIIDQRIEMDDVTDDESVSVDNVTIDEVVEVTPVIENNHIITIDILDRGENDVGKFVTPLLKDTVVLCGKDWYVFEKNTGIWVVKNPSATIISCIQLKIDEAVGNMHLAMSKSGDTESKEYKDMKEKTKQFKVHYSKVCKCGYKSGLVDFLKDYLSDDLFINKLDQLKYKIVYRNGILDLKTLVFTGGIKQTDYVSKTLTFDYEKPKNEDVDTVRETLKKICNYNEEHLKYYLSTLGYALTGDAAKEQLFWYLRGETAENGKSVIFEILENIMPVYVSKAKSDILDKGADNRKELATWRGLRILWLNEVSTKAKDEDFVKAACDGTGMKNAELYAVKAVMMAITFKLFAVSNNSLKIKGDNGVKRRFQLMQFNSQFKDGFGFDKDNLQFKKDKDLGAKLEGEYKHALLHLIFTYSKLYWEDKKLQPYPALWKEDGDEVMEDNNKFEGWFGDNFIVGDEYKITKVEFEMIIANSPHKYVTVKDELKRMRVSFKYDSQERIKSSKKGVYTGFGKLETDDNN